MVVRTAPRQICIRSEALGIDIHHLNSASSAPAGPALPAAPPTALSAALDAGYLPCLERTLRTCFRACNTPAEAVGVCRALFGVDADASWPLLLAFGDEREAAAFLATAAKVARRACQERARPGGDRKACNAVMGWLEGMSSYLWRAADHVALRVASERGFRVGEPSVSVQEPGRETAATGGSSGGEGNGGGVGGGGDGGGSSRLGGDAGGKCSGIKGDHHGGGGGGSYGDGASNSDGCRIRGSAEDTGAGACGGQRGVRSSARTSGGGSGDGRGGGDGDRDNDSKGCGDGRGGGGSNRSGGGCTEGSVAALASGTSGGGGNAAAAATAAPAATTATAGSLSPPEQRLMRLLSFALPLWLPLWLDLAAAMLTDGRLTKAWRGQVHRAFDLLDLVQHMCAVATEKQDLRSAESWQSSIVMGGDEVAAMLDGCRRMLEREAAAAELLSSGGRGARLGEEDGITADKLYNKMELVKELGNFRVADLHETMIALEGLQGGWEEMWPLGELELLAPPCDAGGVLPCCSNPRCAELVGDSEAGVVLRRCGGACGGAAAYCCAACQRAHWAAGHREECKGNKSGGEKVGVAGSG